MKNRFIVFLNLCIVVSISAQKEDYNWISGLYGLPNGVTWSGVNKLNVTSDTIVINQDYDVMFGTRLTCTAISDSIGNPLLYSNGMQILDKDLKIIENGDSINFNQFWKKNYFKSDEVSSANGLRLPQGMLMLPWPERDSILILTLNRQYLGGGLSTDYVKGLFKGVIDLSGPAPIVVEKNIEINEVDSLNTSSLQACRHANGRDWWVMVSNNTHNRIYTYLFTPAGLMSNAVQEVDIYFTEGVGSAHFSPNGDKYAYFEIRNNTSLTHLGHLAMFDFDRCTGMLSNMKYMPVNGHGGWFISCVFSPDGRYLYASNDKEIWQYDVYAADFFGSKEIIAYSDGFESDFGNGTTIENRFTSSYLAPDGRIYISGGQSLHLHRIEYPDERGEAAIVNQHVIEVLAQYWTMPNFPHYRLGPLDNSTCDTLGLNNYPVAKFRYEQDTSDHLNIRFTDLSYFRPEEWNWDFDDGSTFEGRKPYWHTFPDPGNYEVCLTVANENGEDTNCRIIHIGDPLSIDEIPTNVDISINPNPVESDLLITLSEYIPADGRVELYDMLGQLVKTQTIYYGWNTVPVSTLVSGTYIYRVYDGVKVLGEGKLVKVGGF